MVLVTCHIRFRQYVKLTGICVCLHAFCLGSSLPALQYCNTPTRSTPQSRAIGQTRYPNPHLCRKFAARMRTPVPVRQLCCYTPWKHQRIKMKSRHAQFIHKPFFELKPLPPEAHAPKTLENPLTLNYSPLLLQKVPWSARKSRRAQPGD